MEVTVEKPQFAWQPLTGRGVAAFAHAKLGRLFLVQFIIALLAAAAVVWFLHEAWFPPVRQAIRQLPARGQIRKGKLDWHGESPQRLAEGLFLAFSVDLKHGGEARSPAHLQIEFGQADIRIISLLGFLSRPYPTNWIVAFNRPELEPWWGAWSPAILAIAALAVVGGLLVTWAVLATLYFVPVWLVAFFADRKLSLAGSWRLAGAAQMPGALFLCAAIVVYGLGGWDLVRLAIAGVAHFLIGWGYLVGGAFCQPYFRATQPLKANPFAPRPPPGAAPPPPAPATPEAPPAKKPDVPA